METKGDRKTDLRQEQFSENPRLADAPRHLQYHLATNLEGRSPLDFSELVQHQSQVGQLMEFSAETGARYPVNLPNILWELPQFHEAAIRETLEVS
jgi:hypothetical protein